MAQSMTRPGFHPSPWWLSLSLSLGLCVRVCVSLYCFSAWGLTRLACLSYKMLGNEADRVFGPIWHKQTLSHTYNVSCTHIHKESLDHRSWNAYKLLWWVARTFSITLHIWSEDSWGICAYSHNRHRSPDTYTCPGLKAATQTVPCDVFCITLQSEIKSDGSTDTNTNEFILCTLCMSRELFS